MLRPKPVPFPTSFVVKNGRKIFSGCEMPFPLSENETSTKVSRLGGHDLDAGRTPDIVDRVIGVVQNIKEDLLQLVRVAKNFRQPLVEMLH